MNHPTTAAHVHAEFASEEVGSLDGACSASSSPPQQYAVKPAAGRDQRNDGALEMPVPAANAAQTMLHLMRKARGRIKGHVFVRRPQHHLWQQKYCVIGRKGALRSEDEYEEAHLDTFVRDLRGCEVYALFDDLTGTEILHIRSANGLEELQLRPWKQKYFNLWFATLLCWKPIRLNQEMDELVTTTLANFSPNSLRSQNNFKKNPGVIQSHQATMINHADFGLYSCYISDATLKNRDQGSTGYSKRVKQTKVMCTLHGDGKLVLQNLSKDRPTVATLQLCELPRSAVQRLHKHLFNLDRVFGIYPQYALSSSACSRLRPIYLSYDSEESFEESFALFRAHSSPDVYFPRLASSHTSSGAPLQFQPEFSSPYLRIELGLNVLVNRFKCLDAEEDASFYAEILADGQVRARTPAVRNGLSWYEQFVCQDVPNSVSTLSVQIMKTKQRTSELEANGLAGPSPSTFDDRYRSSLETFHGDVTIQPYDLKESGGTEQWWSVRGQNGSVVGEILLKIELTRQNILAKKQYEQLLTLLSSNCTGLTLQIWRQMPAQVSELAEYLLNIFQASGNVVDWLKYLAYEEIGNGITQEEKRRRYLHEPPLAAETEEERQNTAIAESRILFRANTLLTKALDLHMKRIGRGYLEETIGGKMRQLIADNVSCEVDPAKLSTTEENNMARNWQHLLDLTKQIWKLIYQSAPQCPPELREIFSYIRSRAKQKFGAFVPTVVYSSVSGFLFLRFFCAAIMSPHLFGLVDGILQTLGWLTERNVMGIGRPDSRSLRSCLLIAKSIQGLANMTTFGTKESWMSPMNDFYSHHRQELMEFIDTICTVSKMGVQEIERSDSHTASTPPLVYDTYRSIQERLPSLLQEGCFFLPNLIDLPRNVAGLVDLWLNNIRGKSAPNSDSDMQISAQDKSNTATVVPPDKLRLKDLEITQRETEEHEDMAAFHAMCQSLRDRTDALAGNLTPFVSSIEESAESHDEDAVGLGVASPAWIKLAERMEIAPEEFWVHQVPSLSLKDSLVVPSRGVDASGEQERLRETQRGQRPEGRSDETSPRSSDNRHRGLVEGGTRLGADNKGRRKNSASTGSLSKTSDTGDKPRKRTAPSPPRGPEENALRKLGWM